MTIGEMNAIVAAVQPYTMTDDIRIKGLIRETERVCCAGVCGDIVECGVWRGGSMMAVAMALMLLDEGMWYEDGGMTDRELYLFDTFAGMTAPEPIDVDLHGRPALRPETGAYDPAGCTASLAMVQTAMASVGYPPELLRYVKGDVLDTLPAQAPECIALLHLDTDWHKSTRHELETLFPRVSPGGCIMIDDYGHWQGARKATDEYLAQYAPELKPEPCGYTAVILRKP
mgnify:CR=1 FL=1